ncbi:MAG TPA: hypothetical protein VGQ42_06450 [Candidatus Dormibacteraeota bacterium]|jgi:hypothetical protein|nr:hypothetical protein [Candidatus Dormibacteraeota bacterium]
MKLPARLAPALVAGTLAAGGLVAVPAHAFAGTGGSGWCFDRTGGDSDVALVNGVPIPGTTLTAWLGVEGNVGNPDPRDPQGTLRGVPSDPGHLALCWDLGSTPATGTGPAGSELAGGGVFVNVLAPYNGNAAVTAGAIMDPESQPIESVLNFYAFANPPSVRTNPGGPCTMSVCAPLTGNTWVDVSGPIAGVTVLGVSRTVSGPGCIYNFNPQDPCTAP